MLCLVGERLQRGLEYVFVRDLSHRFPDSDRRAGAGGVSAQRSGDVDRRWSDHPARHRRIERDEPHQDARSDDDRPFHSPAELAKRLKSEKAGLLGDEAASLL